MTVCYTKCMGAQAPTLYVASLRTVESHAKCWVDEANGSNCLIDRDEPAVFL